MEVYKEIDDGSQEVFRRVGKEGFRAALLLSTSLIERGQKSSRRFGSCSQIRDIFPLNRIDAVRVFHIGKVDGTESAVLRQFACLAVLAVLIEKRLGQCRILEIIYHHGKSLC